MRIDKVTERLAEIYEHPHSHDILRRFVRSVAYELPRNDLEKLRQFRAAVAQSKLHNEVSEKRDFAKGVIFALSELCASYEACIEDEFEKKFVAELADCVCESVRLYFRPWSIVFRGFKKHAEGCENCHAILEKFVQHREPPSSFLRE